MHGGFEMNFRKKLLAVLLCIVMTITVIPSGSVSAEEIIDGHAGEEYLETDAENLQEDSTAEAETEDTAIEDTDNETAEEDSDSMDIPTENAKSDIPLTPVSEFGIDADDDSDIDLNDDSEISPSDESDYDSTGESIINPTDTIQESEESEQVLADIGDESPYFAVLAFTSDVHNTATNASAARLGNWIDTVIDMYGRIDFMGFCGDLGEDDATEENYWAYVKVVIDLVAEKGVEACYTTGNHEFRPGQFTTTTNPVKNYYIKDTEGKEGDYYRIYCLGTDNWNNSSDNYTNAQIQTLNNYLNSVGNDKPIIILAHYPLHSLSSGGAGWNYGGRQTTNAEQLINMLNQAATNGTAETWDDKTIVFLWGHNHSMSDPHYDEIYAPGTSITYTNSGKSKDISFYYAAAGCMSDGDYSQGSGYVKGKGLVITVDSNIQPGFAYYDANGTNVTEGINYPPEPVHVSQVTLDKSEAQVEVGRTIRLNASVTPEDATDKSVYFSSSDVSVATVSNTGTIKGISEGTAIITVTTADGGHTAACVVTVIPRASDTTGYIITIDGYALSTEVSGDELVNTSGSNQNQKFRYHGLTGIPYTAGDTAGDEIIWLLTESEDGTGYYIQSRDGRYLNATYLTNETNGKDGNLLLDDTPDVWTLDGTLDDWMVSGSLLKSTNSGKSLTHEEESLGNPINLFTVRTTGETSVLTEVSLIPVAVSGITLEQTEETLEVGQTVQLSASVVPSNATNKMIVWTSEDESIASVSNTGKVEALAEGTTVITASAADGGFTASCIVNVIPRIPLPAYVITIDGYALSIHISNDELVNTGSSADQKFRYHGLSGIPYEPGDDATDEILWNIIQSPDSNGYYIQSLDGRYLNATYQSNDTGGKDGILKLDQTPDIWVLDGTLDDWLVSGSLLKSTNAGKSLTHEEESQGKAINLFTIRSTGEQSTLVDPEAVVYHTVTFDANGHGTAPDAQVVMHNEKAAEPEALTETGYEFKGWYNDKPCTELHDFALPVTHDQTIYAKWSAIVYTITFMSEDGEAVLEIQNIGYGAIPVYGGSTPQKAADEEYRYAFSGWTPIITAVTTDATYFAQFECLPRSYGEPVWTWTGDDENGYLAAAEFTTNDGETEFSVTLGAVISGEYHAPTCEKEGRRIYTASVEFKGKNYSDKKETLINALGHEWGNPDYTWTADNSKVTAVRVCQRDDHHKESETVNTVQTVTKEATHTETGELCYTATFKNEAFLIQTRTEILPVLDTTYTLIYDANGGINAPDTQIITNNTGSAEFLISDKMPVRDDYIFIGWGESADAEDVITETTYVIAYPNESFTVYAIWKPVIKPAFKAHSIVTDGQIGVNFYMDLPEIEGVDWNASYMDFYVNGQRSNDVFDAEFKDGKGKYYGFTCYLNSVQMAETITAEFHYDDEVVVEFYALQDYLEEFDENKSDLDAELAAVVEAIADYGHYIQPMLAEEDGWKVGEKYAEMTHYYTTEGYNISAVKEAVSGYGVDCIIQCTEIEKLNYRAVFDSETSIEVMIELEEGYEGNITAAVDGKEAAAELQADGRYKVEITNIPGYELGKTYKVEVMTAGGKATVKVSGMSYVKDMLEAYGEKPTYQNAAASLYYYYHAASEYRNPEGN